MEKCSSSTPVTGCQVASLRGVRRAAFDGWRVYECSGGRKDGADSMRVTTGTNGGRWGTLARL